MARIRSVKPDLFGSYSLASVQIESRFLFIGLFTEADDEGLLIDSPKKLAGAIFPHDEKVTAAKVDRWLSALEGIGSVLRYIAGEGRYLYIPKWLDHQKISHPTPTKLPYPPGVVPMKNGKTVGWLPKNSGEAPENLAPEGEGEQGRGTGKGKPSAESPLTPTSGGTDASHSEATPRLNPRASGTNPRSIAASLAEAEAPAKAAEHACRMARSFGEARKRQGIYATEAEAVEEFTGKYRAQPDLAEAAIQGWRDTEAPEAKPKARAS